MQVRVALWSDAGTWAWSWQVSRTGEVAVELATLKVVESMTASFQLGVTPWVIINPKEMTKMILLIRGRGFVGYAVLS